MNLEIILTTGGFAIALLLFFFVVYATSRNDFVLLRRGIELSYVFDSAVVSVITGLLIGRILFIVANFRFELFNPFAFLHLYLYPGISALGFFAGIILYISLLYLRKKALLRVLDIFSVSLYFLFIYFILTLGIGNVALYVLLSGLFLSLIYYATTFRLMTKYNLKDGSSGFLLFFLYFSFFFALEFFLEQNIVVFQLSITQIVSLILSLFFFVSFFFNQKFIRVPRFLSKR